MYAIHIARSHAEALGLPTCEQLQHHLGGEYAEEDLLEHSIDLVLRAVDLLERALRGHDDAREEDD